MHERLINRIGYIYLPFILFVLLYLLEWGFDYPFDNFSEIDEFWVLIWIFVYFITVIAQTIFFIKRSKIRRNHIEKAKSCNPKLIENINYPERLSYFNVKISMHSNTIDVFDNLSLTLFANKISKTLEIKSHYKNVKHSFNNIDYILFEFDKINNYSIIAAWRKTTWLGSFSIVLKNKKIVHLFDLRCERSAFHCSDTLDNLGEYMDTDELYYKIGLKILDVITNELNMNYSILDYTKKPAANRVDCPAR